MAWTGKSSLEDKPHLSGVDLTFFLLPKTIHFLKSIKEPRYEDYDIRYRYANRFAFLGHGEVKANTTSDAYGLSTYVRDGDNEWGVE